MLILPIEPFKPDSCEAQVLNYILFEKENLKNQSWISIWGLPLNRLKYVRDPTKPSNTHLTSHTNEFKNQIVINLTTSNETSKLLIHIQNDNFLFTNSQHANITTNGFTQALKKLQPECKVENDKMQENTQITIFFDSNENLHQHLRLFADVALIISSPMLTDEFLNNTSSSSDFKRALLALHIDEIILENRSKQYDTPEIRAMIGGWDYTPYSNTIVEAQSMCRKILNQFARISSQKELSEKLPTLVQCPSKCLIIPTFFCDFGFNIHLQPGVYMNGNCVILDTSIVHIKAGTLLGPAVHIYAASHPTDPEKRLEDTEFSIRVEIGYDCWIGGRSVILPGVRIGDGVTIGAGSLVINDIPTGSIAVGSPAKIIRKIDYDSFKMRALRKKKIEKLEQSFAIAKSIE